MKRLFIILFFAVTSVYSQTDIPDLNSYATDQTGTLTQSEINSIDNELRRFDERTSTQVVFLMNNSLRGYPLEDFTYEVAEKNKIGTEENDNGVLFFVAKNDRKMRIEVGYGLEGAFSVTTTLLACGPFWPSTTSNSTLSFSFNVLYSSSPPLKAE